MTQAPTTLDPWRLVWGQPYIDSRTLAAAIEQDLELTADPDVRTRLLVRDAAVALQSYWGSQRFAQWLEASPVGLRVRAILNENLGAPGYSTIRRRLVDRIDSTQLSQIFGLLGRNIHERIEIHIAGRHQLDLRVLALKLDKDLARQRLLADGRAFLEEPTLRPQIEENWRFIFQEPLFAESQANQAGAGGQGDTGSEHPPSPSGPLKRSRSRKRRQD